MTDAELVSALRKQYDAANHEYRKRLETMAICLPDNLALQLTLLREAATNCQNLAQLLHHEEFHAKQKAEMAATAS